MTTLTDTFRTLHTKTYQDIAQTTYNTPLVKLNRVIGTDQATVLAKCEFFNPMASVKDRIGRAMVETAEPMGRLHPKHILLNPPVATPVLPWLLSVQQRAIS